MQLTSSHNTTLSSTTTDQQRITMVNRDIEWWHIVVIMVIVIALILVPLVSWLVHKKYRGKRGGKPRDTPPALMYITSVSTHRTADIDVPVLPCAGDSTFLPPSYEEICNGVNNQAFWSSQTGLNLDVEALPDYASVASQRSSMVLSTFYNDNASNCGRSASTLSINEVDDDDGMIAIPINNQPAKKEQRRRANSDTAAPGVEPNPEAGTMSRVYSIESFQHQELGVYAA